MKATFAFEGQHLEITTEHAASSYGQPVLLVNGELADVPVRWTGDMADLVSACRRVAALPDSRLSYDARQAVAACRAAVDRL